MPLCDALVWCPCRVPLCGGCLLRCPCVVPLYYPFLLLPFSLLPLSNTSILLLCIDLVQCPCVVPLCYPCAMALCFILVPYSGAMLLYGVLCGALVVVRCSCTMLSHHGGAFVGGREKWIVQIRLPDFFVRIMLYELHCGSCLRCFNCLFSLQRFDCIVLIDTDTSADYHCGWIVRRTVPEDCPEPGCICWPNCLAFGPLAVQNKGLNPTGCIYLDVKREEKKDRSEHKYPRIFSYTLALAHII